MAFSVFCTVQQAGENATAFSVFGITELAGEKPQGQSEQGGLPFFVAAQAGKWEMAANHFK
ncbi:hypothetical protein [Heyndrickxia coagulans]|uniref:hypothetical protein n=1 Tax=Heyndrickxia coagulans TaxID=1398 RepID=UPI002236821D|nr:hypothetical protein [Heyndrickxia coagulans]UZH06228.1 hypothetical protein ONG97_15650 [Heyndrickxia coagulans]